MRGDKAGRANIGWHFARQGVLTVLANYRLAPDSHWPSGPQDVVAVWRWLRENVQVWGGWRPGQVVLMGESAGAAHVAAATLMQRSSPHPPTGASPGRYCSRAPTTRTWRAWPGAGSAYPRPIRATMNLGPDQAQWDVASVVDHIDAAPFPMLISYAERDLIQMQVQAGELFARLVTDHGFTPELMMLREHNHFSQGFSLGTDDDSVSGPVLRFLRGLG